MGELEIPSAETDNRYLAALAHERGTHNHCCVDTDEIEDCADAKPCRCFYHRRGRALIRIKYQVGTEIGRHLSRRLTTINSDHRASSEFTQIGNRHVTEPTNTNHQCCRIRCQRA